MATNQAFHTRTALAEGLRELFKQLEERLSLRSPVNVYLAGGMAVHLYTASRVTTDVDAEFGGRVYLPNDLMVEVTLEDGTQQVVYLDTNYNSTFALMHEDYLDDSIPVDLGMDQIRVHVLSPVDLAVSKIARFADNDKDDIAALVRLGLTSADEIEHRATSALAGYIGGQAMLKPNLRDAVALARGVESERVAAQRLTPDTRYTATAILLHWLIALAIIGAFSLGLYMHELPLSPNKLKLYAWHKWAGVSIFLLVLIRLVWRLGHRPPELPAAMPAWQRQASAVVHGLLYVLMIAVPLSGWLMSSAKGFQTVWFGVLPLPDLVTRDETLGEVFAAAHRLLNLGTATLVLVHVAAALKHHFIDRDDVLRRMLPMKNR